MNFMKICILFIVIILLFSCTDDKKTDFIQSDVIGNIFLIENPPKEDSLLKKVIKNFLIEDSIFKSTKNNFPIYLYRYTSNTKGFLISERPGGYFREYLDYYPQDKIAVFIISKCDRDTTQFVGELYFYGIEGSNKSIGEIDTLIYYCK